MSRISRDDVAHVARLARLSLSEEELDLYAGQLGDILDHASSIAALDLGDLAPTAHPLALSNVLRPDRRGATIARDEVLAGAPDSHEGRFQVPRILEEG